MYNTIQARGCILVASSPEILTRIKKVGLCTSIRSINTIALLTWSLLSSHKLKKIVLGLLNYSDMF